MKSILFPFILLAIVTPYVAGSVTNFYTKVIYKSKGDIGAIAALNDTIYFGSGDGHIYTYTPATGAINTVATIDTRKFPAMLVYNKELYIGSLDGILYKYNPIDSSLKFVVNVNGAIYGLATIDKKMYFGTVSGNVYEFNPATAENKKVTNIGSAVNGLKAGSNKKVYLASDNSMLYELDPASGSLNTITVLQSVIEIEMLGNKLYYYTGLSSGYGLYEYDIETAVNNLVCSLDMYSYALSMTVGNEKLYIGYGGGGIRVYDPANPEEKCPFLVDNKKTAITLISNNNKLYFGTYEHDTLEEYSEESDIKDIILNTDLNEIASNSANAILNELHYLNPGLNIDLIEVGTINRNSAAILAKRNNNAYFGAMHVYFTVPESKKTIDVTELLKKATFLALRNTTSGITVKRVVTDNVQYSNVIATKLNDTTSTSTSTTCFGSIFITNYENTTADVETPGCRYTYGTTITNKILASYTEVNNNQQQTWAELLGTWPFDDIPNICNGSVVSTNSSVTLTKAWDVTLENSDCKGSTLAVVSPLTLSVPTNKRVYALASMSTETRDFAVNLKQNISGRVTSTIQNASNEEKTVEFAITDLMKVLNVAGVLPSDIIINNDGSVTLTGTLVRQLVREYPVSIQAKVV